MDYVAAKLITILCTFIFLTSICKLPQCLAQDFGTRIAFPDEFESIKAHLQKTDKDVSRIVYPDEYERLMKESAPPQTTPKTKVRIDQRSLFTIHNCNRNYARDDKGECVKTF
ncbi:uncharacterized protein LOC109608936 [Aethina tumida]|uniref:uncharacterized protein LOC109608936 n=1 Tax=Aethina tumida TaxID=116153 RepID=UPI00096AEE09|nr:uncharacterized protein LOC109608936 [Aethina tumida]